MTKTNEPEPIDYKSLPEDLKKKISERMDQKLKESKEKQPNFMSSDMYVIGNPNPAFSPDFPSYSGTDIKCYIRAHTPNNDSGKLVHFATVQGFNITQKPVNEAGHTRHVSGVQVSSAVSTGSFMYYIGQVVEDPFNDYIDFVFFGKNEYGDKTTMIVPHVKLLDYSTGSNIDDLVLAENLVFEGGYRVQPWVTEDEKERG